MIRCLATTGRSRTRVTVTTTPSRGRMERVLWGAQERQSLQRTVAVHAQDSVHRSAETPTHARAL